MMNRSLKRVLDDDQALGRSLRSLPQPNSPAKLTARLRDVAFQERRRHLARRESAQSTYAQRFWRTAQEGYDRLHLTFENVMRPLAVPVAGGVFAAVTLFGMWVVPTFPIQAETSQRADIPTPLTTSAKVQPFSALGTINGDVLLDVTVDDQGHVLDYAIVTAGYTQDAATRRKLENLLVGARFIPATAFGRPTRGKMRLWLSSSRIDVKG